MNIARAAKGAASLLMVFGLVALVACQAGPAGTPGAKGAKGDTGPAGAPGAPGPAALGAVASDDTHVIYINDGTNAADDPIIGNVNDPKGGVDVTALFAGGVSPIKYSISTPPPSTSTFKASINDDNEIVITKRVATATSPTGDYDAGTSLTVRATDANGVTATKSVAIRTNKKPTTVGSAMLNIVVGTQSEKYSDTYEPQNVASFDFYQRTSGGAITGLPANVQYLFADGGSADNAAAQAGREALTYEISKVSRGTGTGAEYATVELTGSVLTITGLKSTWDSDASPAAHVPVSIEIEATDPGGLSVKRTFRATVDGAPETGATALPAVIAKRATGTEVVVVRRMASFLKEPEGASLTFVGATLTPAALGSVSIDAGNLSLTPDNQGSGTITFYARSAGNPAAATGYYSGAFIDRDADGIAEGAAATTLTQVLKLEIKVQVTP